MSALKFFYVRPLRREWPTFELMRIASQQKLPTVHSREEVGRILMCSARLSTRR